MQDLVIETETPAVIQKHLRQWRHEYKLNILFYSIDIYDGVLMSHIVVERIKIK